MELSEKKVMPVENIKMALAVQEKREFVLAFGELLLRALKKHEDSSSSVTLKLSFYVTICMANFVIDTNLYNEVLEELEEKSWIEQKIINFLQKRGHFHPMKLDLNELLAIGCTHYWLKGWGTQENFKKDLYWFVNELG